MASRGPVGPGGAASIAACVASLANTILGAGILGLPYAVMQCGLTLGLLLLAACAAACAMSLHLLALSARTSGVFPASFYTVASASIPHWAFVIDLAVASKCFGVATSYLIVVGDLMPTVMRALDAPLAWQARNLWVTLSVLVAGPLACAARLEALKLSSLLAICCIVYLAVLSLVVLAEPARLACAAAPRPAAPCRGLLGAPPDASALRVVSIFIFAFTCQQNIFSGARRASRPSTPHARASGPPFTCAPSAVRTCLCAVVNELRSPHVDRLNRVIGCATALALSMYATVATAGYLTYGSAVRPDLLVNYPTASGLFIAARVGISVVVVCAYPLQAHPSRKCALSLLRALASPTPPQPRTPASAVVADGPQEDLLAAGAEAGPQGHQGLLASLGGQQAASPPSDDYSLRYWLFTCAFVLASWRIALSVTNLGKVMAVVGATGSTAVSYILPGACYWKLHPQPHAKRYVAGGMFCLGVVIIPTALHAIFAR